MNLEEELPDLLTVVYMMFGFGLMLIPFFVDWIHGLSVSPFLYWGVGCAVVMASAAYGKVVEVSEQLDVPVPECDSEVELQPVELIHSPATEGDTAE